jgi:hypothetical protein
MQWPAADLRIPGESEIQTRDQYRCYGGDQQRLQVGARVNISNDG